MGHEQGHRLTRRSVLAGAAAVGAGVVAGGTAWAAGDSPRGSSAGSADLILRNGRITTLDKARSEVAALAIKDGRVLATGTDAEVMSFARRGDTEVIDLGRRRVVPGLHDSHTHMIRGGLTYTTELYLTRCASVREALGLIRRQAAITPPGQIVRAIAFTQFQFREKRLPTLAELNAAAPDVPVLMLHLYDRMLLNRAAMQMLHIDKTTPDAPGGVIQRDSQGNPTGMLIAAPAATILNDVLTRLPQLDPDGELVSTRFYVRHLNERGVTSLLDAAGGGSKFPGMYTAVNTLHAAGQLNVRIGYHLYCETRGRELEDFQRFAAQTKPGAGDDLLQLIGAGEQLTFASADFSNFNAPEPELVPEMEQGLAAVLQFLGEQKWPFRMHAPYDQDINRFLNVIERTFGPEGPDTSFIIDHAETATAATIERLAGLGGRLAAQHRVAYQGEYLEQRYGADVAHHAPPVREALRNGVPLGLGTDASIQGSDNLWEVLHWFTTGTTAGGTQLTAPENVLSREEALRQLTVGSAAMAGQDEHKGLLKAGFLADLAVLTDDYFAVPQSRIPDIKSVLTLVGGRPVYAAQEFRRFDPAMPRLVPAYSPIASDTDRS